MNKEKKTEIRGWVILGICVATLLYNIISTFAIRGNDLEHISQGLNNLTKRVERIENFLMGD